MSDVVAQHWEEYSLLVDGYVRRISHDWDIYIPSEICSVIFEFYPKMDKWDKALIETGALSVNDNTNTVTFTNVKEYIWKNAFGKHRIKPQKYVPSNTAYTKNGKYNIIHSWRIKIIKARLEIINIGIVICSRFDKIRSAFNYKSDGYGIYVCHKTKYGPITSKYENINRGKMGLAFEEGDTVEVILLFKDNDYGNCCIGYRKNESEIEIAFDDLDVNEEYAVAVAMHQRGDCVQIVE